MAPVNAEGDHEIMALNLYTLSWNSVLNFLNYGIKSFK